MCKQRVHPQAGVLRFSQIPAFLVSSGKHSNGISPFLIGKNHLHRVHFPASYVRLPECTWNFWRGWITLSSELVRIVEDKRYHMVIVMTRKWSKKLLGRGTSQLIVPFFLGLPSVYENMEWHVYNLYPLSLKIEIFSELILTEPISSISINCHVSLNHIEPNWMASAKKNIKFVHFLPEPLQIRPQKITSTPRKLNE